MKTINNLEFELYYGEGYCSTFNSLDKAIKTAVDIYKNNPDMAGYNEYYKIKFGYNTVVTVRMNEGNIVVQ